MYNNNKGGGFPTILTILVVLALVVTVSIRTLVPSWEKSKEASGKMISNISNQDQQFRMR